MAEWRSCKFIVRTKLIILTRYRRKQQRRIYICFVNSNLCISMRWVQSVLSDLHWLPVCHRLNFKIAIINMLQFQQPSYLAVCVRSVSRGFHVLFKRQPSWSARAVALGQWPYLSTLLSFDQFSLFIFSFTCVILIESNLWPYTGWPPKKWEHVVAYYATRCSHCLGAGL